MLNDQYDFNKLCTISHRQAHYFPTVVSLHLSKHDAYRILQALFLEMQTMLSQAKASVIEKSDPKQEEVVLAPHAIISAHNSYDPSFFWCYPGLINRIHQQVEATNELTSRAITMSCMTGSIGSSQVSMQSLCSLLDSYVKAPLNCADKNDACN